MAAIPLTPLTVILGLILAIVGILGIVWFNVWLLRREQRSLEQWAAERAYTIVSSERPVFSSSPFGIPFHSLLPDFRIHIVDSTGNHRHAWVRIGDSFTYPFSRRVRVRWDDRISSQAGFDVVTKHEPGKS